MKPVHFYSCLSKALVAGLILTGALSTKVLAEEADPKWKEPYDTPVTITTVRGTERLHFILIQGRQHFRQSVDAKFSKCAKCNSENRLGQ